MAEHEYATAADVVGAYERGERTFVGVVIRQADFRGQHLEGAGFAEVSLPDAVFDDAHLADAWFSEADLPGASFERTTLYDAHFIDVDLPGSRFRQSNLSYGGINGVDFTDADLSGCNLTGTHVRVSAFQDATMDGITLGDTAFSDTDLSPFCDAADLVHEGPSYVDLRSVLRSYRHPGLKRFLIDCGVPPLIAEYTIAAAEAEGDALATLMRSTFISYGGPDEAFARRLYEELRAHGVTTFFFPETARLGKRIGDEVHSRIQEHDRVILICSRASLDRPGVRNEIQETFDREARDGGATYLLPIRLDDYVLTGWDDPLAPRVRDRVVGDFTGAMDDDRAFDRAMRRLLAALKKD